MWFLRAWKIGELQQLAAQKEMSVESINPTQSVDAHAGLPDGSRLAKSSIIKRLMVWERV